MKTQWFLSSRLPIGSVFQASEDMAPLFFDADGDMDLYVVSGCVECEGDHQLLHDQSEKSSPWGGNSAEINDLPGE